MSSSVRPCHCAQNLLRSLHLNLDSDSNTSLCLDLGPARALDSYIVCYLVPARSLDPYNLTLVLSGLRFLVALPGPHQWVLLYDLISQLFWFTTWLWAGLTSHFTFYFWGCVGWGFIEVVSWSMLPLNSYCSWLQPWNSGPPPPKCWVIGTCHHVQPYFTFLKRFSFIPPSALWHYAVFFLWPHEITLLFTYHLFCSPMGEILWQ